MRTYNDYALPTFQDRFLIDALMPSGGTFTLHSVQIRGTMVSIVVSIQAIFRPFPPSRRPDKPRGLYMYPAILPDLRPKR
jgi:hypothetical protein